MNEAKYTTFKVLTTDKLKYQERATKNNRSMTKQFSQDVEDWSEFINIQGE